MLPESLVFLLQVNAIAFPQFSRIHRVKISAWNDLLDWMESTLQAQIIEGLAQLGLL